MTNLKYVGTSDIRRVGKADFTKLGVEGDDVKAVEFKNGEVKDDLPDEVVQALLENPTFVGEFKELSDEEVEAEQNKVAKKAAAADKVDVAEGEGDTGSGEPNTTTTTRGGAKKAASSSGRGSST